jgi:AFG3 family protein
MEPSNTPSTPPSAPNGPFQPNNKNPKFNIYWVYGLVLVAICGIAMFGNKQNQATENISESQFNRTYVANNWVAKVEVLDKELANVYLKKDSVTNSVALKNLLSVKKIKQDPSGFCFAFPINDYTIFLNSLNETAKTTPTLSAIDVNPIKSSGFMQYFNTLILPILLMAGLWMLIMRKMGGGASGGGPGGIFNIGKSKAQLYEKGGQKVSITFAEVAGLDEAKVEVMEIVDFLKNPKKYTALGGKIPRGCLLVGPPGTGKTLLAKAMAGEAQVPFFSMSGSDFVEMFVGVGASRVRDLFKQAREKSPCIIFIDEIDAIGRARGKNAMASNDERENTLNQMLVEMDGFSGDSGIIVLAATNRPDVLDQALLRPGRFDRQISIDIPDLQGREDIFKVHLKSIKTVGDLDIKKLALQTPGFAGADIANICNEAALIAARSGKTEVDMKDFNDAVDRVIGGLEKRNKLISPDEKKVIAFHEAGHAVSGWFLKNAHPLVKVTIVPRGSAALGYAQYLPKEKYLTMKEELEDDMCMTLGGRAVEELVFGRISTGALSDLQHVTKVANAMVTVYGMSDKVGNVCFYDPNNENGFTKPFSEETGKMIDAEIRQLIDTAYIRVKKLLSDKMPEVEKIANELLSKEVLYKDDLTRLIGERPFENDDKENEVIVVTEAQIDLSNTVN